MRPRYIVAVGLAVFAIAVLAITRANPLPDDVQADRVVVEKQNRLLALYADGKLLKSYKIALGFNPQGHKQQEGDGRTPEGQYVIDYRNPRSSFHLSLHITYPNSEDKKLASERGVSPGGDIFIHGLAPQFAWVGAVHTASDWTDGCIAVTNEEIEELWRAVPDGTPIEIRP